MSDDTRARQAAAGPDVVARLRDLPNCHDLHGRVFRAVMDAAAAIEARDAEIARLREALDRLEMHAIQDARHWYSVPAGEWEQVFLATLAPPPASDGECCQRTRLRGAPCPAGRTCPHDTPAPAGCDEGTCNR